MLRNIFFVQLLFLKEVLELNCTFLYQYPIRVSYRIFGLGGGGGGESIGALMKRGNVRGGG